ncbi:hypothetical protein [Leadbettera azotonutricia]|uniref:Uncharacterized protein n=1 Tax=Leadbettera azotonutricia (strain ATCC BAA-888 / DSM 13862 / ZAS-9) TaxID=545695 RepID=F5YFN6_LEAAZ|nr:hypothetical protein [Leadbettera azotonutricia]AEF82600.1 hypothetical protein TREAZ_2484 [Leadbettera azotonutricia ZAS-9]
MQKFYLVFSEFYDSGVVKAAIVREVEAAEKPKDTFKGLPKLDVYGTWYASKAEAEAAVIEARKQSFRRQV